MFFSKIQWAPTETLFKIGSFGIHYYSLMFVIAFSLGFILMKKMYKKEKVSEEYIEPLLFYVVIATFWGTVRRGLFLQLGILSKSFIEILLPI